MTTPIYMLYMIKRKEAWYRLRDEARDEIAKLTLEATTQANGKRSLLCDATWSSGACEFFELTKFEDLSGAHKRIQLYKQKDLFRYYEISTVLDKNTHPVLVPPAVSTNPISRRTAVCPLRGTVI